MGIPEERYSRITAKNQREICLLRGFPCAWGKCAFCDYIEDNGRDREAMEALNRQVLSQVTGELGALEIINSGSCFELPEATLDGIGALVREKKIEKLFFEAHWIYRHKLEEMRERAREYFPVFGLEGYEDSYPASLSGGMRQRAAFLRTALCSADILLLDEPFGALDVITRGEMQDWLLAMRKELGKTVVLVTHDMDEAIYLSDRILILNPVPAGIHGEISVCETQRDRDWLYGQGELRREIHGQIMGKERRPVQAG